MSLPMPGSLYSGALLRITRWGCAYWCFLRCRDGDKGVGRTGADKPGSLVEVAWGMPPPSTFRLRGLSSRAHPGGSGCTFVVVVAVEWRAGPAGSSPWPGHLAVPVLSPLCPGDFREAPVYEHLVLARHVAHTYSRTVPSELWTARLPAQS